MFAPGQDSAVTTKRKQVRGQPARFYTQLGFAYLASAARAIGSSCASSSG
jgi:hypothetical protein